MTDNIYAASTIDLETEIDSTKEESFYVVSTKKLTLLFIFTMGIYALYWHYKNWSQYKKLHDQDIWPVPRAIFSVFFTHALFEHISLQLQEQQKTQWKYNLHATILVIANLITNLSERLSYAEVGAPYTDVLGIALSPIILWQLFRTQKLINTVCGDANGENNTKFTPLNYFWMALGLVLWALVFISLYVIFQ
jgi:hypothetical protein